MAMTKAAVRKSGTLSRDLWISLMVLIGDAHGVFEARAHEVQFIRAVRESCLEMVWNGFANHFFQGGDDLRAAMCFVADLSRRPNRMCERFLIHSK